MGQQTVGKQSGHISKRKRSEELIERDISIYQRSMMGLSIRAICDEYGLKSTKTVWDAIRRGKQYALERGISAEERKIQIDAMFQETLVVVAQELQSQHEKGRTITTKRSDGSWEEKHLEGVDPRTAAELGRSLTRWAELHQILDRAPEVNQQVVSMVNLSNPTDGASFAEKWSQTIDVTPSGQESGQNTPAIEGAEGDRTASKADNEENRG